MSSTKQPSGLRRTNLRAQALPVYCDFSCPHAAFPPADAVGACRREVGVYCSLLNRYNNKNGACLATKSRA
jgi:hypothetical protein